MADNIGVTPGTGKTVLADEVTDGVLGTGIVQIIKVMDGTLDGTNKLVVSSAGAAKVDGSAVNQPIVAAVVSATDATLTRSTINISTATDTTLVSATASQYTRLHRLLVSISGAVTLTFKSASTSLGAIDIPSAGLFTLDFANYPWFKTAANEALVLTTSAAVNVKGAFDYVKSA